MIRPCRRVHQNPPEPEIANVVANLQWQLLEQQQETNQLCEQIVHMNQMPHDNEAPTQNTEYP